MTRYEYKVVPAPDRGVKARGIKGPEGRFAHALEVVMNDMGAEGWEYQRAETLPSEERQGLSGRSTVFRNMLVFRRPRLDEAEAYEPRLLDPPKDIPVLDAARALAEDDTIKADNEGKEDAEWTSPEDSVDDEGDLTTGETADAEHSDPEAEPDADEVADTDPGEDTEPDEDTPKP